MASFIRNLYTCGSSQWEQNANLEIEDGFEACPMNDTKPLPLYIVLLSLSLSSRGVSVFRVRKE